jgi:multiple sugar transport system substrate-binding protein
MQKLFRPFFLLLVAALLLSALGCGGQPAAQPTSGAASQPTSGAAQPTSASSGSNQGQVTVNVLAMQQAGPTPDEMNAIVTKFNQSHPDIKVNIEYVSYDALHDKIVTAMAANPPAYDVILVDDIWYAEFAKNNYLLDVTDKIASIKDQVFPAAWDITTVDGKTYGMPWLLDEKYFYYNKDILQQAGISAPPATWEEMVDQAKTIKDKGLVDYPIVWSWGQAEAAICDFVTLLYGNGGQFMDAQGNPAFNDPKGVATVQWMLDTLDQGISNPASVSYVEEDVRNVFSQGKAAFATNWVYMYELADLNQSESQVTGKVGMSLMPAFKDGGVKSATINGSMGFSVVSKSDHPDAAWQYVQFLTSQPIQEEYSAHLLPIWQNDFTGQQLEKLKGLNQSNPVTVPMFKEQFPFAQVRPKVPYYPEGSKALQLALQQALTKQKTPQQALDDAAATWKQLATK